MTEKCIYQFAANDSELPYIHKTQFYNPDRDNFAGQVVFGRRGGFLSDI